jgi:hypothetical protein
MILNIKDIAKMEKISVRSAERHYANIKKRFNKKRLEKISIWEYLEYLGVKVTDRDIVFGYLKECKIIKE